MGRGQRGDRRVFTTFPYRTSSVTRCLYIVKYRGGGCLFPKLTPYVSPKVFQKERRARRGGLLALALPTSTLYTGIDSTVTYSRLGSTIQTVNGGGVVVLYLHRLTKSSAPAAARTCRSRGTTRCQSANRLVFNPVERGVSSAAIDAIISPNSSLRDSCR